MTTKRFRKIVQELYCDTDRDCDNVLVELNINGKIVILPVRSIGCDDEADWIIRLKSK